MSPMLPAAILAGGLATRLRPLTDTVPKALVPVCGKPFIAHQLRLLASRGIRRVVICTGHLGSLIEDFVGDGRRFELQVAYSADGERLLGTAGAIRKALPLLGESFFVVYGDSYLTCDWQQVQQAFLHSGQPALMTVFHNRNRWEKSNVELAGGRIVRYDKQSAGRRMEHIDYGLGVFRASAFEAVPAGQPADLAQVYQQLAAQNRLVAHEVADRFYEIGSPAGLQETEKLLLTPAYSVRDKRPAIASRGYPAVQRRGVS